MRQKHYQHILSSNIEFRKHFGQSGSCEGRRPKEMDYHGLERSMVFAMHEMVLILTYFTDYFTIADNSMKMKMLNSVLLIHSKWN